MAGLLEGKVIVDGTVGEDKLAAEVVDKINNGSTESDPVFTSWLNGLNLSAGFESTISPNSTGIAIGRNSSSSSSNTTVVGNFASVAATGCVAIGFQASAAYNQSVALGNDSITTENLTVSVGNSDITRKITNVSAGTAADHAVTVGQMNTEIAGISSRVTGTETQLAGLTFWAGTADEYAALAAKDPQTVYLIREA